MTAARRMALLAVLTLLFSCDILRDAPFRVTEWSPGEGYHASGSFSSVRATFSAKPDRESVERAFSLEADGTAVRGGFSWDGKTLSFTPFSLPSGAADYVLSVNEEAQDGDGVSMNEAFEGRFTTRPDGDRPAVTSTLPADGGTLATAIDTVEIRFSTPVEAVACADAVSFSPQTAGAWSTDESGKTAIFEPAETWPLDGETTVTVPAEFRDRTGRTTGVEHRFSFRVGSDREDPYLMEATALDPVGTVARVLVADDPEDAATTENPCWEGPWRLSLRFSEEVELSSLDSRVAVEGGPTMKRETALLRSTSAVYRFSERPVWGSRFSFRIAKGVTDGGGNASAEASLFRVTADGPRSRPPRFVGLRLPLAPGAANPADHELTAFPADAPFADLNVATGAARYPLDIATPTWIELYFELAEGASLDRNSIMEKFRVEATNDALSFSAANVVSGGGTVDAYPPWASYARCRVDGSLTNRTSAGVVTFSLAAGFKDSFGNETDAAAKVPLVK